MSGSRAEGGRGDARSPAAQPQVGLGCSVLPESDRVHGYPVVIDLDGDRQPEVVFVSSRQDATWQYEGSLRAVSGRDGSEVFTVDAGQFLEGRSGLAAGDIDNDGRPEIIGRTRTDALVAFEHDGTYKWTSPNLQCWGNKAHAAIADIDHDGSSEIVICATVLNSDGTIRWQHTPVSNAAETAVADINLSGDMEVIDGRRVYSSDGTVLWEISDPDIGIYVSAVANLDEDPYGEVIMVDGYHFSLYVVSHEGAIQAGPIHLPRDEGSSDFAGGSPIVADVDGDGRPEIGLAIGARYSVFEHDGTLKWSVPVGDFGFSRGSAVADLNGDGAAEIVFHGPQGLVIFRGADGRIVWEYPSPVGAYTFSENLPLVADADADGHAEIISNWTYRLGFAAPVPGIQVFGHESWMPTRPIWNQHSYHITNVNDDGTIPRYEEPNWEQHNSYRANERLEGPYPPWRCLRARGSTKVSGWLGASWWGRGGGGWRWRERSSC